MFLGKEPASERLMQDPRDLPKNGFGHAIIS